MDYKEYREKKLKLRAPHKFKVTHSHTSKDIYRWIIKNNKDLKSKFTEKEFGIVVKTLNRALRDRLLEGRVVRFPKNLGKLELLKVPLQVKLIDGKLKVPYAVDWGETLHLWHEDKEAEKEKRVIYRQREEMIIIRYNKKYAVFNNKSFYSFIPTRDLKKEVSDKAKEGLLDALSI